MSNVLTEDLDTSTPYVDDFERPRPPSTPSFSASTPVIRRLSVPHVVPFESSPLSNSYQGKTGLIGMS